METKLIPIGNSKGIRIPKSIIEKYQFGDMLDLVETDEGILVKSSKEPRKGWDEQFKKSLSREDEFSGFRDIPNDFDTTEWTW